jgi:hypothetical protein
MSERQQTTRVNGLSARSGKQSRAKAQHDPSSDQAAPVDLERHEYHCTICSHAKREEVERAFLNWTSPSRISKQYSVSRDSIYRHAHALGLMEKRRRNSCRA